MPQARDEAGNIWETDAQGNAVRLVQAAQAPQTVTLGPRDPAKVRAEERAQEAAARSAAAAERQADAAIASANRAADAEERAGRKDRRDEQTLDARGGVETTEGERKAAFLATRVAGGLEQLRAIGGGTAPSLFEATAGQTALGNYTNDEDWQRTLAVQRDLTDALLTLGTGAAYTAEQIDAYRKSYFPQPGDKPQTIADKQKRLQVALEASKLAAGAASGMIDDALANSNLFGENAEGQDEGATAWDRPDTRTPTVATGGTRTVDKPEVASKAYSMLRAGAGFSTIKSALGEDGAGFTMSAFSEAKKRIQANPDVNPFVFQQEVPTTALQRAAGSGWGSAGVGAANAVTMGGLDEITGAINSLRNGSSYAVERDIAQGAKEASQALNPGAYFGGELASGLTAGVGGGLAASGTRAASIIQSLPGALGIGATYGGVTGALEQNDNRLMGGAVGAGAGAAGGILGRYALGPLAERFARVRGNAPRMERQEAALPNIPESVQQNLADAQRLGLPYTLADADPALRVLAGSVTRKSPNARALAEAVFEPRARGQADRLVDTIDARLAPVTDINARSADIMKGGNIEAGPYYSRAKAQPALDDPVVGSILNTKTGKDALKRAYNLASNERRDPNELGFILDPGGEVRINDAGRYSRATLGNERDALSRGTVRGYNGGDVPVAGPVDLVGWMRMQGGLREQAGELGHMGLDNRARSGMDFVGQEARFGPLVNEGGMNLDDAAQRAWEAGYFPELTERPSVAEFLDALRFTHDGTGRRFLPDAAPEMEAFEAARANRLMGQEARSDGAAFSVDNSVPAGPDVPFAPPGAYGQEVPLPTYETLHYVRQGFDDILDGYRDKVTGQVNLDNEGRAIANLRRDLSGRLQENPDFRQGDAIYAKAAQRRDALRDGFGVLPRTNVPVRDFEQRLAGARDYDADFTQEADRLVPELQRGYATSMADTADKARLSSNPWEAVYGSPAQQSKVGALFPDGAGDFGRAYQLERDMSRTAYETVGGSPTAARMAADEQMGDLLGSGLEIGADVLTGGGASGLGMIVNTGRRMMGDAMRLGVGKRAAANAERLAPTLFNSNPEAALEYLIDLGARRAAMQQRKQDYSGKGALLGALIAPPLLPSGS